jgi:glycerol-3-phosphate dehydrogenase
MQSLFQRDRHLEVASNRDAAWDLAIIGGGASGVGTALDAAARGLSVVLLEQSDFGKGTSSRSTKLIHGGVRYLEQGNVSLVRESLRERARLLRNASHVVHPLEFVLPCRSLWQVGYYGLGMKAYDWLASSPEFHHSTRLNRSQLLSKLSTLSPAFAGGISYYDGQFDDARLLINLVQTAAEQGATLVNAARVIELTKSNQGRVNGLVFVDAETGQLHRIAARCVLNATGPFCDKVRTMDQPKVPPLVAASQGIHLVIKKEFYPDSAAMIVPKTKDGRVMFIIPWHDHVLLGTTDTPISQVDDEPRAFDQEIDFLLETTADYLQSSPMRSDCLSVFVGIRPLVKSKPGASTASLARDHFIEISPSGLMTMTGGKWTTYRQMAEDCVDRVISFLGEAPRPCTTHEMRLHGANVNGTNLQTIPSRPLQRSPSESASGSERLRPTTNGASSTSVYGTDELGIAALIQDDSALGELLHQELGIRKADVVWAAQHEWARTVEDVLARRTRALFLNARAAVAMAPEVARLLAGVLKRDEKWQSSQVAAFSFTADRYILDRSAVTTS